MNITTTISRSIKLIALLLVCLPSVIFAQASSTDKATQTPVSVMGRRVTRIADPLSENTEWIDKHTSQQKEGDIADVVVFHFRVNSTVLEPNYMDNARSMAVIDLVFSDSTLFKNNKLAMIIGSASPEGYTNLNKKLAEGRALSTKKYILSHHPTVDRDKISTYAVDEDWDGFRKMVMSDIYMAGRNQTIEIIDLDLSSKQKLDKIKKLHGGKTYQYIKANIFPYLRGGVSCTFYTVDPPTDKAQSPPCPDVEYRDRVVETLRIDTVYMDKSALKLPTQNQPITKTKKPFYLAVKTNMLYDAVLLPNLAIEFPIGKRWSVEVEGMESWWNTKSDKPYTHRIQTLGIETRKWLGNASKAPLTGHFVGVYAMGGTYDLKTQKEKGSLSNWTYSAGLSYGYAMPIAPRFNLEFGVGVGYVAGEYKKYTFDRERDCYSQVSTHNRSYFGPTKAKVSLVWLIGSGFNNKNQKR